MSRTDMGSAGLRRRPISRLLGSVGLAAGPRPRDLVWDACFEELEGRVMLSGDHPSFNEVFLGGQTASAVPTDGSGAAGIISPAGDDDLFTFTAPQNDFVRVWADTLNAATHTLDSQVKVYTLDANNQPVIVATGTNNGTLTSGVFNDGWVGFKAVAGKQYFVDVLSDTISGAAATGNYILRVNATSTAFPTLNGTTGAGTINGTVSTRGGDVVYALTTPASALFDSLLTIASIRRGASTLDTRLDIYDSAGQPVQYPNNSAVFDDDSGNLSDSYLAFKGSKSTTYYIRVRSDQTGAIPAATGNFTLNVDGIGTNVVVDPVTRLGNFNHNLASVQISDFYTFQAQGTGFSFISVSPDPNSLTPIPDSAIRFYDDTGAQVAFNELPGPQSQVLIQLTGGKTYYVVVENFDGFAGGDYIGEIEAHHTFDPTVNPNQDDHESTPTGGTAAQQRDAFERATPIVWGPPVNDPYSPTPPGAASHTKVVIGHATGRLFANGDTDLFQFVPPQDMLGVYHGLDDAVPPPAGPNWQNRYLPASRLQILVGGNALGFEQSDVRVFDSNFALVWTNATLVTTGPDPAGMADPASWVPTANPASPPWSQGQPDGLRVWGGEVYYLEVSGTGDGRYDVEVMADAPTDTNLWHYDITPTHAGDFANAMDMNVDPNTGETRNYANVAAWGAAVNPDNSISLVPGGNGDVFPSILRDTFANRLKPNPPIAGSGAGVSDPFDGTPGTRGRVMFEVSDLGNIQTIGDTQLYKFRALYTGTAEVRLQTTQITDEFFSVVGETEGNDPAAPPPPAPTQLHVTTATKTYNSPLDGALRIFDNDFQQLVYNNDSEIVGGETQTANVGSFTNVTFNQRDPRAVFNVEAGNEYYVEVSSGQAAFAGQPDKVDWRHATGSYQLLVNSMPNQLFIDDHENSTGDANQTTPIPLDVTPNLSTSAILGTVDGEIRNVPTFNPRDDDTFFFYSPGTGTATVTVVTREGDAFGRNLIVVDAASGAIIAQATQNNPQNPVTVNMLAKQGQKFYVIVAGASATDQGRYTVQVSGVPFQDDHASVSDFADATVIDSNLYDFSKTATVNGDIENAGDTDVFAFNALTFDTVNVAVRGFTPNFSPFVRVYEISEDPDGHPIRLQIGYGAGSLTDDATTTVSLTFPRVSVNTHHSYPTYYVVVSGLDPNVDFGQYGLTLTFGVATDDHPDSGQFDSVRDPDDTVAIDPNTGHGSGAGVIEQSGDTDLFQFTAPAGGPIVVNVTVDSDSLLYHRVQIYDSAHNLVTDSMTGFTHADGQGNQGISVASFHFLGVRNSPYYILVSGLDPTGNTVKTSDHGAYSITVASPIPDDHPNEGEFPGDNIHIAPASGIGVGTGNLEISTDGDLFNFVALGTGSATITVDSNGSGFTPQLRLFDPGTAEIGSAVVGSGGTVTRTINVVEGSTYYLLVSSNPANTGSYTVTLHTPRPNNAPPDDHPNAGQYPGDNIPLDRDSGQGTGTGVIELDGDTDLFNISSLAGSFSQPRQAFVQVITPSGSVLKTGVKIFDPSENLLVQDETGGPGYNSGVTFNITSVNQLYYIEVDDISGTGAYTVRVSTGPSSYQLFYPEGFANSAIREYVSVGNANPYNVSYSVTLRYEGTDAETVVASNLVIPPNSRGGITISDGPNGALPGVEANHPYSIIIQSSGFLAANISHYDFHATLGEAFTSRTSTLWSFARGDRQAGVVNDFVVTYNPNPTPEDITFTAYKADGSLFSMTQTVLGLHRGGWNLPATAGLGTGQFAFTVTSAPHNPGDTDIGIVAALSHYDLVNHSGYGMLGDPDGGATAGLLPGLMESSSVHTSVTFFNTSATPASVSIVGRYIGTALPDLTKLISINPFSFVTLTGTDLGFTDNQLIGLRYDSNVALSVLGGTTRPGSVPPDATTDTTGANTEVAPSWFWGDAFINSHAAGNLYFENMYLYNPDVNAITVRLTFLFNGPGLTDPSTTAFIDVTVGAKNFAAVALNQLSQILTHRVFNYFSVQATAVDAFGNPTLQPFAAKMNHYDLVLDGAWGSRGAPLGLADQLSTT